MFETQTTTGKKYIAKQHLYCSAQRVSHRIFDLQSVTGAEIGSLKACSVPAPSDYGITCISLC